MRLGRYTSIYFIFFCCCWGWACQSQEQEKAHPAQLQFQKQLAQSCLGSDKTYQKSISFLPGGTPEIQRLPLVSDTTCILPQELVYALKFSAQSERIQEYYNFTERGDTLSFSLLPETRSRQQLQSQQLLYDSAQQLRYVASHIRQAYWLYEIDINIAVYFDKQGQYQSHQQEVFTEIIATSAPFHARIAGEIE